jgi:hypothetical protein
MTIGPLFFAAPWALAALAALPLLFLLLRAAPPAPARQFFPPLRLLLGLRTEEESRKRAPLWLVLLRALAAALMIIGFARPSLAPQAQVTTSGPALIVIDDGWPAAPAWAQAQAAADDAIADAERARRQVLILTTAPQRTPLDAAAVLDPADARARIARLRPSPWRPDRAAALKRLPKAPAHFGSILWITDGLDDPGAAAFAKALAARGPVTARVPAHTAQAIMAAADSAQGVEVDIRRAPNGPIGGAIAAETLQGRSLGAAEYKFDPTTNAAHARIELPPEIAARVSRVRIVGESSAGAVRLLPSGAGRPFVGLIDPGAQQQPLLSDLFYVERAIAPFATTRRGETGALIQQGAQAIVLPDASRLSPPERAALESWIEKGGLLIRFAGPRLANDADDLLPVHLRPGSRALGGALAWETPQPLAPFPEDSPFAGLTPPADVTVRRQVLAEPASESQAHVWARLSDGASIVTAAARGKGLIVLFQVTAGPDWSDLPLSGLYVDMLRRTLAFAGRAQGATEERSPTGPWLPERLIDGFGALAQPNSDAKPVPAEAMNNARAGPSTPPGLYVRAGSPSVAIDTAAPDEKLQPLALPAGIRLADLGGARSHALGGVFLAIAALMIALDLFLALILAGAMPRLRPAAATAAALALLFAASAHERAHAQSTQNAVAATLETRLAYIRTGDTHRDRITAAGLQALSDTLTARTSVEPGAPIGVDPARDDLSPYPILYWAAPDEPHRLSDAALANLDRYMRLGGLIFLDTRDSGRAASPDTPGPAAIMLQGLDAPPLEPVGPNHVLTKTFYLMQSFPGRFSRTKIWAESASAAAARDGVPALIIGDGDWASEWAADQYGDSEIGGGRQRELSLRFGVNLVMLALTGNYKADQVHVPALLERLGESRRQGGAP